jgi:hypothetical protein
MHTYVGPDSLMPEDDMLLVHGPVGSLQTRRRKQMTMVSFPVRATSRCMRHEPGQARVNRFDGGIIPPPTTVLTVTRSCPYRL